MTGHYDNRQELATAQLADPSAGLEAVHTWHTDVEQHRIYVLSAQLCQRLCAAGGLAYLETRGFQHRTGMYAQSLVVVYDENGVTVRTIPAVHGLDGAVSFILEWNGLKFAYSSDTFPNKWWLEHTKGVDISIHECFIAPESLVEKQGFTPQAALNVGTQIHTSPAQFGKVMAETKPRMAVGYHFFNDFDTQPAVLRDVRRTYDGPLALAVDYMVFNVTKDDIKVRMAAVDEDIWPQPSTIPLLPPDPKLRRTAMSDFVKSGRVVHKELLEEIYAEINEQFEDVVARAHKARIVIVSPSLLGRNSACGFSSAPHGRLGRREGCPAAPRRTRSGTPRSRGPTCQSSWTSGTSP